MEKVIGDVKLYTACASYGVDLPSFAMICGKAQGFEREFFQISQHVSDRAALNAASLYLEKLDAIPEAWLTRLHSNPESSSS